MPPKINKVGDIKYTMNNMTNVKVSSDFNLMK